MELFSSIVCALLLGVLLVGVVYLVDAAIALVGVGFDHLLGTAARVKAKFGKPKPVAVSPTAEQYHKILGDMHKSSDTKYVENAKIDYDAAQKHLKEQLKKAATQDQSCASCDDCEGCGTHEELDELNADLKKAGLPEMDYEDVPKQEESEEDDLSIDAKLEGIYAEIDSNSQGIDELRAGWKNMAGLLQSIMDELGKKAYKVTTDDQFVKDAELSNSVAKIATHTAKKTVENGLTQALPDLVKQAMLPFMEDELKRLREEARTLLKLEAHNVVKELGAQVGEIDQDLDEHYEEFDQLATEVDALKLQIETMRPKLAKAAKPKRK